ncbi:hypothetical protein RRG08_016823 [Elysia crispata]|uniref:Uncharacterized protein n=1 Tax=Elysia crispata TaxID=231223 RepID=A0AAE0ZZ47_9GAST|nr:hypothetical protein RRG08_016823 [Elysia crispata]
MVSSSPISDGDGSDRILYPNLVNEYRRGLRVLTHIHTATCTSSSSFQCMHTGSGTALSPKEVLRVKGRRQLEVKAGDLSPLQEAPHSNPLALCAISWD